MLFLNKNSVFFYPKLYAGNDEGGGGRVVRKPGGNSDKFSQHKVLLGAVISVPKFRTSEIYVVI